MAAVSNKVVCREARPGHGAEVLMSPKVTPARCMQSASHTSSVTLADPALMNTNATAPVERGRAQMLTAVLFVPLPGGAVVIHLAGKRHCEHDDVESAETKSEQ